MSDLKIIRKKVNTLLSEYKHFKLRAKEERGALTDAIKHAKNCERAQVVVQLVAEKTQQLAQEQIAAIVTRCLRAVFDDPYRFKIQLEKKRGKTEARLTFIKAGYKIDPINGAGGGVVDVASFALQIACILLQKPNRRKIFIADEPFKHLSYQYRERVKNLIESLAEDLNFQFILVTHDEALQAGKVVEIR